MATKKFNEEVYKQELQNTIAAAESHLAELRNLPRPWNYNHIKEVQNTENEIMRLQNLMTPKFINEYCYSDRHAYEVIERKSEKVLSIRRLIAKRTDNNGMSESQTYEFTQNLEGGVFDVRMHKDGCFYEPKGCNPFILQNEPYEYFDFSF